jgi:L-fuculose-phosphate aldolase
MFEAERRELADTCRRVAAEGLVVASSGNVSMRVGELVLATPRRIWLERMRPELCVVVDLDGKVVEGSSRPSSETPFHLAIYKARPELRAVVHTHSRHAVTLSAIVRELPAIHYSLAPFGGVVKVASYSTFGSSELASSVVCALDGRLGALMQNHGAVTVGESLAKAFELSVVLEWLCSIYYHARLLGDPALLGEDDLEAVRAQARSLDQIPFDAA